MNSTRDAILLYNPRPNPHLNPVDVPLSLLCVSRFLEKDGYNIKIVSENLYENHLELIRRLAKQSKVFGVSSMTGYQIHYGLIASRIVKEENKDIKVVWGGWHPSLYPNQALNNPYIDIVVKGQGERAFYEIVKRIEAGKGLEDIKGVHWKDGSALRSNPDRELEGLDDMPPIPYQLVDVEKCLVETEFGNRTINYVSSYGCPYRCGFCCEQTVNKRRWVGLSAGKVVSDLARLESDFGINGVSMYDSNFFVDINRSKEVLQGMIDRGIKLRLGNIDGRAKQLADAPDELWSLLEKTRSYSMLVGAESGDQEALDAINKDTSVQDNIRFARKCHGHRIKVLFSTLVGIPLHGHSIDELNKRTDKQINATIAMFDKLLAMDSRHRGLMFIYYPYPGTPLYRDALSLGFKEPRGMDEWSHFNLYRNNLPWISKEQEFKVGMLSSYIFLFLDSDTLSWLKERIKQPLFKIIFIAVFKAFAAISRLRWRYKYFGFPIDYRAFCLAKKINKWV